VAQISSILSLISTDVNWLLWNLAHINCITTNHLVDHFYGMCTNTATSTLTAAARYFNKPVAWFIRGHFCHTPRICNLILLLISVLYRLVFNSVLSRRIIAILFSCFFIYVANINGFAWYSAVSSSLHRGSVRYSIIRQMTQQQISTTKLNYIF